MPTEQTESYNTTGDGPRACLLRLRAIIGPNGLLPIARSTFLEGVKAGRYPAPIKLGPRITAWREEDIRRLIAEGVPRAGLATKSGGGQ
jgi:prophage regulatory protein